MTSWHGIKALLSIDAWLEADGLLLAMYLIVQPQMVALHAFMLVTLCFAFQHSLMFTVDQYLEGSESNPGWHAASF